MNINIKNFIIENKYMLSFLSVTALVILIVTVKKMNTLPYEGPKDVPPVVVVDLPTGSGTTTVSTTSPKNIKPSVVSSIKPTKVMSPKGTSSKPISSNSPQVKISESGCGISLNLLSNVSRVKTGERFDYVITVSNLGTKVCTESSLSLYYPDNIGFIYSEPKATASNYYWKFGNLEAGDKKIINLTVNQVDKSSSPIANLSACLTAENGQDACTDLSISILRDGSNTIASGPSDDYILKNSSGVDYSSSQNEYGSWVWVSPKDLTDEYTNKIIEGAHANGINALYITIDDYLDISYMSNLEEKERKKKEYSDALQKFITKANSKGIVVDAEAGWRNWAEPGQREKALAVVAFAMEYNNSHAQKLRAVQYDVEPYLLPNYDSSKAELLKNFVSLIDDTITKLGTNSLKLNVVIPHFYDDAQKWTPEITYKGETAHTFNHLMKIMDRHPGGTITIMAYRNFTDGTDGSLGLSSAEIDQASVPDCSTKIIVALETGDVTPEYVTFYGRNKSDYVNQINKIREYYKNSRGFGGVAVHYVDTFLKLE